MTQRPDKGERDRRARVDVLASRDDPDRKAIPDGPDLTARAASRGYRASPVRRANAVRPERKANRDPRASPAQGVKPVRAARPALVAKQDHGARQDRRVNYLRSNG